MSFTINCIGQLPKDIWKKVICLREYDDCAQHPQICYSVDKLWVLGTDVHLDGSGGLTLYLYDTLGTLLDYTKINNCISDPNLNKYTLKPAYSSSFGGRGVVIAYQNNCDHPNFGICKIFNYVYENNTIKQIWQNSIDIGSIVNKQVINDYCYGAPILQSTGNEYILINNFSTNSNYQNSLIGFINKNGSYYKNTWFKDVSFLNIEKSYDLFGTFKGINGIYEDYSGSPILAKFKFNNNNILERTWSKDLYKYFSSQYQEININDIYFVNDIAYVAHSIKSQNGSEIHRIDKFDFSTSEVQIWNSNEFVPVQLNVGLSRISHLALPGNGFLYYTSGKLLLKSKEMSNSSKPIAGWKIDMFSSNPYESPLYNFFYLNEYETIYGLNNNSNFDDLKINGITFDCSEPYYIYTNYWWLYKKSKSASSSIHNVTDKDAGFSIYPNPSNSLINLSIKGERIKSYKVSNSFGIICKENVLEESLNQIDINDLIPSLYNLWIYTESGKIISKKFIKI